MPGQAAQERPGPGERACASPLRGLLLRPSFLFLALVALLSAALVAAVLGHGEEQARACLAVRVLGLSDLCLSSEAFYTRHPAISDPALPFLSVAAGPDIFPSGAFIAVPSLPLPRSGRILHHGPLPEPGSRGALGRTGGLP